MDQKDTVELEQSIAPAWQLLMLHLRVLSVDCGQQQAAVVLREECRVALSGQAPGWSFLGDALYKPLVRDLGTQLAWQLLDCACETLQQNQPDTGEWPASRASRRRHLYALF